jgi:hypothetical protein
LQSGSSHPEGEVEKIDDKGKGQGVQHQGDEGGGIKDELGLL